MQKLSCRIAIIFLIIFSLSNSIFAQDAEQAKKEKVRVAYFYGEGFQDTSPIDGSRFGYGYEYLQKLAYFAGWEYEYIDTNWAEAVEMIRNGSADILAEVSKTPEREKFMLFAEHEMGAEEYYIFIQEEGSLIRSGDLTTLNNRTVGVNAGTYQLQVFREWCAERNLYPNIIEYEDEDERNKDFLAGRLEAAVDYDFYLDQGWLPLLKIGKSNYYMAVTPSRPDILERLNYAQGKLFESSPLFIEHLQNIYFPHEVVSKRLTLSESSWLKRRSEIKGKLKIGYIDNYLPYCSKNKGTGELEGALAVFLDRLKEVFGINIEPVAYDSKEELYEALLKNEIPACFPVYNKLWQSEQLGFMQTEPLLEFPQAIVFRKGQYDSIRNMKDFAASKTSPMQESYILDKYPDSNITKFDDYGQCFKGISEKKVGAMFLNTYTLTRIYNIYQEYSNLEVVYLPNDTHLCIGVNYDCPELLSVFNKVIVLLDDAVMTSSLVYNSQTNRGYSLKVLFREHSLLIIITILILSAFIILLMRYQLSKTRAAKLQADKAKQKAENANLELEAALKREKESQSAVQEAFVAANKANAAKTEFLASMSHDIRTPMNAIIGMTAIAAANLGDQEKIQHCLTEITASSKHLLGLINEVLDMNKIESGKVSLNESAFNLAEMIDDCIAVAKSLVKEKKQEFNITIHDIKHEDVIGDESRLQQCVMNFISNSVKYTPEGGTIGLSISEKPVNRSKVGCYEFVFEDNGIGMSEDFIPKMFEPFTRAEDDRVQNQQGTGLGMPITRNILRMMNGDIKVESKLNVGTKITATIYLELQSVDEELDVRALSLLPVLVADDDQSACESTCFVLNSLGMNSEWVLSGEEAVEKIIEHHKNNNDFFATIIDWKMPGMDGVETTRQIREAVGNDVPIIIVSAFDWTDIEAEARGAGASGFIAKPIFKSKVAHTFLELTGKEPAKGEQNVLKQYNQKDFKNERVLLVEDNKVNAEIAKEILGMTGLEVDIAWNGQEAVEKMFASAEDYYKMVFMDLQMLVMNGFDAAEQIREGESEYLKNIPIVAMSANAFAEDVQKAKSVGMNEHIAKPLDFDKLLKLLNKYL